MLEDFTGTILLVSHDRYLIDRLATQMWELRGGRLNVFKGTYREFVLRQATGLQAAQAHRILLPQKPMVRDNSRDTKRRTETLTMVEERIREQEMAIQRLSRELEKAGRANNGNQKPVFEQMQKLSWQVAQAQAKLESLMSEWEKLVA